MLDPAQVKEAGAKLPDPVEVREVLDKLFRAPEWRLSWQAFRDAHTDNTGKCNYKIAEQERVEFFRSGTCSWETFERLKQILPQTST